NLPGPRRCHDHRTRCLWLSSLVLHPENVVSHAADQPLSVRSQASDQLTTLRFAFIVGQLSDLACKVNQRTTGKVTRLSERRRTDQFGTTLAVVNGDRFP